ncbi:unnamed protein product [Rhizoctonia solani]|uniref:Yeast cell wall synthesis Kre9/Knh1-like N-terminal domain-containing protein n=1 Tax=Rhizoctonia solani TaxID=456999 RepID=A0A8H3HBZ5_9AGAM|nr:unnamed protein product [Rhizoctonia solani]
MLALGLAIVAGAVAGVVAAPNPTEPSGTSVFNVGQQCTIKWDPDTTSTWKNMNIQLMTGDNFNMIHLSTIAQNVDATTQTTYSYTCPDVTPNSAIYFYQFSSPTNVTDLLWTTRWTIASADGKTTPPTETTQPNGDKFPWGKGALVDPSTAVAPPSYLTNNQSNGSANTTSVVSASSAGPVVTSTTPGQVVTSIVVATSPAAAATTPAAGSSSHAAGSSSSSTRAASTGATTGASSSNSTGSTTTANGAATTTASGFAMIGALVAALGLF